MHLVQFIIQTNKCCAIVGQDNKMLDHV